MYFWESDSLEEIELSSELVFVAYAEYCGKYFSIGSVFLLNYMKWARHPKRYRYRYRARHELFKVLLLISI